MLPILLHTSGLLLLLRSRHASGRSALRAASGSSQGWVVFDLALVGVAEVGSFTAVSASNAHPLIAAAAEDLAARGVLIDEVQWFGEAFACDAADSVHVVHVVPVGGVLELVPETMRSVKRKDVAEAVLEQTVL